MVLRWPYQCLQEISLDDKCRLSIASYSRKHAGGAQGNKALTLKFCICLGASIVVILVVDYQSYLFRECQFLELLCQCWLQARRELYKYSFAGCPAQFNKGQCIFGYTDSSPNLKQTCQTCRLDVKEQQFQIQLGMHCRDI